MREFPLIRPMMAVPAPEPPADDDRWGYEFKWDGVRAITYVSGGRVRAMSRGDRDVTASYPELSELAELTPGPVVLDGELVALHDGRPDFGRLQARMHVRRPAERLVRAIPVEYFVFDVLRLRDRSLLTAPYTERRAVLADLALSGRRVRTPPWFAGGGPDVLAASIGHGLEGVLAKRLASRYLPGRRSTDWLKIKNVRHQEVVIGGWRPGKGRRAELIGSLLIGIPGDRGLEYAGNVGTGFTHATLRDLAAILGPLEVVHSPFVDEVPRDHARDAHWVRPALVGEVEYAERTADGMLRHPSWRGLRADKDPADVHIEDPR
jgi:bifunctional non-homologous end joining protein LigD